MQKFLSLVITAAVLYMIFQMKTDNKSGSQDTEKAQQQSTTASTTENQNLTGNFLEKTVSNVLINVLKTEEGKLFFENILQPVNKPIAGIEGFKVNNADLIKSMFKINDFGEGTIGPASCGHVVTVSYQILDLSNNMVDQQTKTFTLGSQPVIAGLDNVIVGMMVGQTRHAIIPAKYAYQADRYKNLGIDQDATYKINVALKEILPHNFAKIGEVKIFDDEIAYRVPLICGDRAIFNAKITKLANGKVIYDTVAKSQKIQMRIGDINYPMIFSHALYGKIPIGTRTVIAKGRNYKALGAGVSVLFPKEQLPTDEYFMLELSDFETE
ncbi:Peptidyl-prolyl cis-trans isomerase [Candidatus Trichorickettsia mobilis]|uniref:peptidylprolyl isomerase n=1 Tax=Candidatus Trichorickettsia mobilis TaxID=1346319 RepID=A0ABZ0UT76_9RICK|nr:FKBP-type peptidyl-prolyl cis-trans isomerase [Candidatus Trichorickettsia mobilis]WPY00811.1 Peptidyl-prolyl cis-trans isomerase [Candidatus Trichorickettsia mobilis]